MYNDTTVMPHWLYATMTSLQTCTRHGRPEWDLPQVTASRARTSLCLNLFTYYLKKKNFFLSYITEKEGRNEGGGREARRKEKRNNLLFMVFKK